MITIVKLSQAESAHMCILHTENICEFRSKGKQVILLERRGCVSGETIEVS